MRPITKQVMALAAPVCHVSVREIGSIKCRYGNVPMARFLTWWLLRGVTDFSLPQIALEFDTDHATVLKGVRRCEGRRETDAEWRRLTDKLKAQISRTAAQVSAG
jgi:chromosomal replication initiation ATPase DnaA